MDAMLQPPSVTTFDAVASVVSLIVYLGVAVAALGYAPRDTRARVFLAIALSSAVPYVLSPLQWWIGNGAYTPAVVMLTSIAFGAGSAALFHFSQVFPTRRPWIRAHWRWLVAAYLAPVLPLATVAWVVSRLMVSMQNVEQSGAGGLGAVSLGVDGVFLLLALPAVFLIAVVLPFCAVMSLFKSWQEAKKAGDEPARVTTFWILISQMAGGVLAILVLPLLHVVGIGPPWATLIAALTYVFGLLMPVTFASAVWRYRMLSTSI